MSIMDIRFLYSVSALAPSVSPGKGVIYRSIGVNPFSSSPSSGPGSVFGVGVLRSQPTFGFYSHKDFVGSDRRFAGSGGGSLGTHCRPAVPFSINCLLTSASERSCSPITAVAATGRCADAVLRLRRHSAGSALDKSGKNKPSTIEHSSV